MPLSNQTLLDAVESVITTVLAGGAASYSASEGGFLRQVTKLDLEMLMQRRDKLIAAIAREQNGIFSVAEFRSAR